MKQAPTRELTPLQLALAAFGPAAIALLLGAGVVAGLVRAHTSRMRVAHTHEVIETLDRVLVHLVDAETSVRGYALTSDATYLEPYAGADTAIRAGLARLRVLTADPVRARRLDTLQALTAAKLALLDSGARLQPARASTAPLLPPVGRPGKVLMDSVRHVVAMMQAEDLRLLSDRSAAEDAQTTFVGLLVVVGSLIAAGLALLANGLLRGFAARQAANAALLDEANQAKMQFLSKMSHELRTPLNAIDGYAELITMGIRGPVTPEQVADLERMRQSGRFLLGLINDILDFAKLEAGRVEFHFTAVRLGGLLANVGALVAPQAFAKRVAFCPLPCDPALTVRADEERLTQVVINLVTNAIKYTDAGGTITVACEADGERARVRVTDTGHGIPRDKLRAIFDPFVQVDRSRGTGGAQQGVGLGLAISRDLVRQMGGDLTVESVVGRGSTFGLSLPRAEFSPSAPTQHRAEAVSAA